MRTRLGTPVSAVVIAFALAACGSAGSSGNGIASGSPMQIANAARRAIAAARSVHMSGSIIRGGIPIGFDLHVVPGTGAAGTLTYQGIDFEFIARGRKVYLDGGLAFWRAFGNPRVAQLLAGKWFEVPAEGNFASIERVIDVRNLIPAFPSRGGGVLRGSVTTVDGKKVVPLRTPSTGAELLVAATGVPYPVEARAAGIGSVRFDQYNAATSINAPANVVSAAQLTAESSRLSKSSVAGKSAADILAATRQAITAVNSVHTVGTVSSGGSSIHFDLQLVAGVGATGEIASRGLSVKLIVLGRREYMNAGARFWHSFGGAAAAKVLANRWVKIPATVNPAGFAKLTDLRTLFAEAIPRSAALTKGSAAVIDGQPVIALHSIKTAATLYIATTGAPYPVRIVGGRGHDGSVVFDQYNQPVSLAPPANAVDPSSLVGG